MKRIRQHQMRENLARSGWREFDTGLESSHRVYAVGDVHGQSSQFMALLDAFETDARSARSSTLVVLGDLVDRGHDCIGAVDAAIAAAGRGFSKTVPLMGNHEQMLRLTLAGQSLSDFALWRMNGADSTIGELDSLSIDIGSGAARLGRDLRDAFGAERVEFMDRLGSHHAEGNLLFVHAGVHPRKSLEEHFAQPWHSVTDDHWAWIRFPFLSTPQPAPGKIVVHGHTPVQLLNSEEGSPRSEFDPHLIHDGRMNLDAGSYGTGRVAGAIFERSRYRVLIADRSAD